MTPGSYVIRPISDRTHFQGKHQRSNFATAWPATERLLLKEVQHLRGRDLVIEVDASESDIRLDGRLRATARPATPCVRVAFESIHGPLTYATDRFTTWQDNVRAIALGLEALRRVDRYGITKKGEQYAGWKAIGAGSGSSASHMTRDEAYDTLYSLLDLGPESDEVVNDKDLVRRIRIATHPDHNGGDHTLWNIAAQALGVLGLL